MASYPVIMCGGSGTRLWPASRPSRPKQFLSLTGERSLFQETVLRLVGLAEVEAPVIVAGVGHRAAVEAQLAELGIKAHVLLEPEPRNSAPAMAAAAAWLSAHDPEAVAVVLAADHHVPDAAAFRQAVETAVAAAKAGRIVTLGVRPTGPVTAYGYIRPDAGDGEVKPVAAFVEKPDAKTAEGYVAEGYLWNSGNFVVSAKTLEAELEAYAPGVLPAARRAVETGEDAGGALILGAAFREAPKDSIDYAVMEKTKVASVLPVDFDWSDLGAWDSVMEGSARDAEGNSGEAMFIASRDVLVRAPAGIRVAAIGVSNLAVIADGEAILVCDLNHSQSVKQAAEALSGPAAPFATLQQAADWYRTWLTTAVFPLWATLGVDHERGGFRDALSVSGAPLPALRRGRTQGRQIYVFAEAGRLGWQGPWRDSAWRGIDNLKARHLRPDGLVRSLLADDGAVLDDNAAVYDQAFALLAMASLHQMDPGREDLPAQALNIRAGLEEMRHPAGLFREVGAHPFQANCNMHLFEAALAWEAAGEDAWSGLADEIAEFALAKFIDAEGGFLREFFDADWKPAQGDDGRLVEPGHQFEWAWLLERWGVLRGHAGARAAARKLYEIGLKGVDAKRGVAVNALWDDLSVRDASARLWPQTEYLKAAAILGDHKHALAAAGALHSYLQTPVAGVWFDKMRLDGGFVAEPAPATSLYHILCAALELFTAAGRTHAS